MGILKRSSKGDTLAVGTKLAALLPENAKPWYKTPHLRKLNCILLIPWLSATGYGFDVGSMMNGLQSIEQWWSYFGSPSTSILGTINAIFPIGKFLGLFLTAWASDRYGRKLPMYTGYFLMVVGAVIQGAAQNLPMFIIARFIIGFGTAGVSQPAPIMVSELSYPTHRGRLTSMYYSTYALGGLMAAWTTFGTFRIDSTWSWRIPSLLQGAIPLCQFFLLYFVPESPRYLIAKGRIEEARQIFVKYHAGGDESSPLVAFEMQEIQDSINLERQLSPEASWLDFVRTKANRKRTFIAVVVGIYGTWSGIALISYYLKLVLDTIGITESSMQTLINAILNVQGFIISVAVALLVDRLGRRPLWLCGVRGMLVSFILWTALSAKFTETGKTGFANGVLAFIFIYKFWYETTYSPLLLAYPIEVFPYTLRSRGLSISMASNQVALIAAQFGNPAAIKNIGWRYYIVICVLLLILLTIAYFVFPETKGRTLEEIREVFEGSSKDLTEIKGEEAEAEVVEDIEKQTTKN
ncbi:hypothetical protein AJ80_07896 [Polytolypa hystricis UAMH7299]|uniref:Major facilitator superfamily (MFS) profile domain-containing protein n=1 Tax=Polytolypa hystricis (strain UAMH7299) TaxID=1447883 RepID=A0A2B7XHB0_POLH7|nr:hypothetical protein AJ80_07896 [Polytolypa hystricis UAMH7299]